VSVETETLRVMPREMRMMSERILSLTALPKGFALTIGDVVMVSQALGLGGVALLETRLDTLRQADPFALSWDGAVLDAGGQHAWFAVPSALDLLGLMLAQGQRAELDVAGTLDPEELAIAAALGRRVGLAVQVVGSHLSAEPCAVGDPLLHRLMQDGCRIPAALWWRIYALAQSALTPDSALSRRHAGPVIVTEDGKVIGRTDNDDDTDVSFIGSVPPAKAMP
jgi:hypothetical protein